MARFMCVSDTHNQRIPRFHADVLIHAGDLTTRGTEKELIEAAEHIAGYPARIIIVVPGNHDLLFETHPSLARRIFEDNKIKVLINEGTETYGVNIWGSPNTIECWGAFQYNNFDRLPPWDLIPKDTEILITHSPPKFILDKAPDGENCGCPFLAQKIREVRPKYHIFGHIHCANGREEHDGTTYINAAICSEKYQPLNPPQAFNFGLPGSYEYW